jgi:hypothetical protein
MKSKVLNISNMEAASIMAIHLNNFPFNVEEVENVECTKTKRWGVPVIVYKKGVIVNVRNGRKTPYKTHDTYTCTIISLFSIPLDEDMEAYYAISINDTTKKKVLITLGEGKNNWI